MSLLARAQALFQAQFNTTATAWAFAPGRVNLLGGHVDYNDGLVLPVAIDRHVVVCGAPSPDPSQSELYSEALDRRLILQDEDRQPQRDFSDHARGLRQALRAEGYPISSFSAVIVSDLPMGSGLSSSSALELALGLLWARLFGFSLSPLQLARACQSASHRMLGVRCGLMDPLVCAQNPPDGALLIDCRSGAVEPRPLNASLVVFASGDRRQLVDSAYNERRADCEAAVSTMKQQGASIAALRDLSPDQLSGYRLPPRQRARAQHVVEEIDRVKRSERALLAEPEPFTLGRLMYEGHRSARDLYQISTPRLDALVEACQEFDGSYGGRLTGAGFGGCTVHLVRPSREAAFMEHVRRRFESRFSQRPKGWWMRQSPGAMVER